MLGITQATASVRLHRMATATVMVARAVLCCVGTRGNVGQRNGHLFAADAVVAAAPAAGADVVARIGANTAAAATAAAGWVATDGGVAFRTARLGIVDFAFAGGVPADCWRRLPHRRGRHIIQ